MEGGDQNGAANGGSRWNPTKDQINMLEGLYKQGLRTPTAQQIQQITARLRDFGHIEGKNVFYWFQNHKARQRQKQKQIKHDHFTYFNRFTHPTNPVFPPFQNVVCSPYYSADRPTGFYQQYPKVQPHTTGGGGGNSCNILMKRSSGVVIPAADETRYNKPMHEYYPRRQSRQHQETLDLFPIHPTGVLQLQAKHGGNVIENKKSNLTSSSSEIYNDQLALAPHEKAGKDNHFFDFFSCQN